MWDILHANEIVINEYLYSLRTPVLDAFFQFLNFFDTPIFYFILIPAVWVGFYWKWGARLLYLMLFSSVVNSIAKVVCMQPRPFEILPELKMVVLKSHGFPSGAAQSAIILAGLLIGTWKKKYLAWSFGISYVVMISLSRLYLGVHFFSDVVGGWILGGSILGVFAYLYPKIEKFLQKQAYWLLFIYSQLIAISSFSISFSLVSVLIMGANMGCGCGLVLSNIFKLCSEKIHKKKHIILRICITLVGVLGLVTIVYFKISWWINFFILYLLGLWISFLCNIVFRRLKI